MSNLPNLKPKEVIKRLKQFGFVEDHQTGSHVIFYHPETHKRAVIPNHVRDLPKGTLAAILREAGISKEEFASN